MNFVTVTCAVDLNAMILQAASLEFVIDNIIHFVIIQDTKYKLEYWYSVLAPYYTRHKLVLIQNNLQLEGNGWRQQQVLKLEISNKVTTDDYFVLDSKNFFIKPFNLCDWDVSHGNGSVFHYYRGNKRRMDVDDFLEKVSIKFNKKIPMYHIDYMTPFKLNTNIINTIIDADYKSLFFDHELPSEFALYNMFIPPLEIIGSYRGVKKLVVNYFNSLPTEIDLAKVCDTAYVLGIHRSLRIKENNNRFYDIIKYLGSKGLNKSLLSETFRIPPGASKL